MLDHEVYGFGTRKRRRLKTTMKERKRCKEYKLCTLESIVCEVCVHADGGWDVVVLHPHHDLLLHGQPCRLSHRPAHGVTHRVRRGPRQADQDQIWLSGVGLHQGFLQGKLRSIKYGWSQASPGLSSG
jgi:hypothetical protein